MSALFFDIDGTILSEITHEIPESALVALRKAQENGHKTFINTGRNRLCFIIRFPMKEDVKLLKA